MHTSIEYLLETRHTTHLLHQAYKTRPTFSESIRLTADTAYSTVYMCYGYAQDFQLSSDSTSGILVVFQMLSSDGKRKTHLDM